MREIVSSLVNVCARAIVATSIMQTRIAFMPTSICLFCARSAAR